MVRKRSITQLSTPKSNARAEKKSKADEFDDEINQPGEVRPLETNDVSFVEATATLNPPLSEDVQFRNSVAIDVIHVASWAKIEAKVRHVRSSFDKADTKPIIVSLVARGPAANKCISIAEIAKRELLKDNTKLYQYTGYWVRRERHGNKQVKDLPKIDDDQDDEKDEEDDYFEKPSEGQINDEQLQDSPKVRNMPCLVIYLTKSPVSKLRTLYGEQICESKATS